jgi:hypothetical protein
VLSRREQDEDAALASVPLVLLWWATNRSFEEVDWEITAVACSGHLAPVDLS